RVVAPVTPKVPPMVALPVTESAVQVAVTPLAVIVTTSVPAIEKRKSPVPARYHPLVVSLAQEMPGAAPLPLSALNWPVMPPSPLRARLPVMAVARSLSVVLAHEDEIVVPLVTGFPTGRVYVPALLRGILNAP